MKTLKEFEKLIISIIITIGLIVSCIVFYSCTTVQYKEYTGIVKCDFSIMLAKIKSKKGYSAFEIGEYVKACFSEIDRANCKKAHFPKTNISYDKKDVNYIDYLSCLESKKK